jgi:LIM domain
LQLIFSGEYTKAMNKDWHSSHFCCWQCDESLTGNRYVLRDDHPYCIKCYESVFANQCEECNKTIGIDSKVGGPNTMLILFNAKCKCRIYCPPICIEI